MDSERISDAEVREDEGDNGSGSNEGCAVRVAGETQNHSSVLCLDHFGVARQIRIAFRAAVCLRTADRKFSLKKRKKLS
jgi:hypothetical protein